MSFNQFSDRLLPSCLETLLDHAKQSIEWANNAQDIVKWVKNNRFILGEPWSYESSGPKVEWGAYDIKHDKMPRPYLLDFVRDQTPEKSICKNRQSEISENHINEALYYCLSRPYTRISHLFASNAMSDAISNEKLMPAISGSPNINEHLIACAVRRYAFDNGSSLTINGVLQRAGGRASSRDILIFDEIDSMPESVFGVYEELLSHSALRFIRKISTPTIPQVGIDAVVRKGSGFEWLIKCEKCKKEQFFSYPDNIINYFDPSNYDQDDPKYQKRLDKTYFGCKFCKEYIDRGSSWYLSTSKWVAQRPSLVGIHNSYYICAPMIPWKTGKELTKSSHALYNYPHQFVNEKWGCAYMKTDQRLGEHEIRACECVWGMTNMRIPALFNISVGIDFGLHSSWILVLANGMEAVRPNRKNIIYVEEINALTLKQNGFGTDTTEHIKRVRQLCDMFQPDIIVGDVGGLGLDRVVYLTKWFPDKAWGCFFDTAEEGRQIRKSKYLRPMWNKAQRRVTISKVNSWKEIIGEFRRQSFLIPRIDSDIILKLLKHLTALGIQPRWSESYQKEFEVVVRIRPEDHLACALMYAVAGWNELTKYKFSSVPGIA